MFERPNSLVVAPVLCVRPNHSQGIAALTLLVHSARSAAAGLESSRTAAIGLESSPLALALELAGTTADPARHTGQSEALDHSPPSVSSDSRTRVQ